METALFLYRSGQWQDSPRNDARFDNQNVQLVLAFGAKSQLLDTSFFREARDRFPGAELAICSTAGEIFGTEVYDDTVTVAAIRFRHTTVRTQVIALREGESSYDAGRRLAGLFDGGQPASLFILSDGSRINGSELVRALNDRTRASLLITGGLAGDGSDFVSTLTGLNAAPREGNIVGIGFYGDKIKVRHGSGGGWETFGMEKTVTRSVSNVLYEIDHKNALELYKKYLGSEAELLPSSALLFPLAVTLPDTAETVVRTILSIDTTEGSMTFAGDIPEGATVRFMRANFDKITEAAAGAARQALIPGEGPPHLALLVSCIGRKLILKDRAEEGPEAISETFGQKTKMIGFYSYGELAPATDSNLCQLHNQTMTITTFYEAE